MVIKFAISYFYIGVWLLVLYIVWNWCSTPERNKILRSDFSKALNFYFWIRTPNLELDIELYFYSKTQLQWIQTE